MVGMSAGPGDDHESMKVGDRVLVGHNRQQVRLRLRPEPIRNVTIQDDGEVNILWVLLHRDEGAIDPKIEGADTTGQAIEQPT